jgi:hypothetical protein
MRATETTRRKRILPIAVGLSAALCCQAPLAEQVFAKKISISAEVTATKSTPYRYTFSGSDYTTCALTTKDDGMTYEQNCGRPRQPLNETTRMGYTLRLESSGHRVMDVTCVPGVVLWSGSPHDCAAPENGSPVQVEVNGEKAKLTWSRLSKTAAKSTNAAQTKPVALSETYRIVHVNPPF